MMTPAERAFLEAQRKRVLSLLPAMLFLLAVVYAAASLTVAGSRAYQEDGSRVPSEEN
jgi:hypothetical protein